MKKEYITQILRIIWTLLWILFALFITYQILIKVFGGSWISEVLILTLVVLNLTQTYEMKGEIGKIAADISYLKDTTRDLQHQIRKSEEKLSHKIESIQQKI